MKPRFHPLALALVCAGCPYNPVGIPGADGGPFDSSPTAPPPCASCPSGQQCDFATGQCIPDCRTGAACAAGQCDLSTGNCVPVCEDDAGCDGGVPVCVADAGACAGGFDAGGCTLEDAGCAPPLLCRPSTGTCVECLSPADCPAGTGCNAETGSCGSCLSQSDCGDAGTVCDLSTYVCRLPCADGGSSVCAANAPLCDIGTSLCVQCLADVDCDGGHCGLDLSCGP